MTTQTVSKRLLIVDDEPAILKLLKTLLSRAKYQVATCGSGEEALRMLSQGPFDLIITDAVMPVMTGFELVRTVRANPNFNLLPVLMLTRKSERADVQKALEAGVTDYIVKPIDEHLLIEKVNVSLHKREAENRLREVAVHGIESQATTRLESRVTSVREAGMMVRFPISLPDGAPVSLDTPIFKQIGIASPVLKLAHCELKPVKQVQTYADFPYEAELIFVGMPETDLRKIRTWLQQQEIQRKK